MPIGASALWYDFRLGTLFQPLPEHCARVLAEGGIEAPSADIAATPADRLAEGMIATSWLIDALLTDVILAIQVDPGRNGSTNAAQMTKISQGNWGGREANVRPFAYRSAQRS